MRRVGFMPDHRRRNISNSSVQRRQRGSWGVFVHALRMPDDMFSQIRVTMHRWRYVLSPIRFTAETLSGIRIISIHSDN